MTVHPVLILFAILSILIMVAVLWLLWDGVRYQFLTHFKKNRFEQSRVPIRLEVVERQDVAVDLCLEKNDIVDTQLHFETIGAGSTNVEQSTYPVTLLPNHKFVFQGQSTLLTALDEEGLKVVNSDCRAGFCGQCKVRLVEGQVRWLIQPECKIKPDEILLCCCVPEQALTLQHSSH